MKSTIEDLQQLVKAGNFEEAARRLRNMGKPDRKDAALLGNIAWRIQQPALAIKVLHPIVRSTNKLQRGPTPEEKIEYAEALRRLGAVDESWELLGEIDGDTFPQATLYKIFCLFNRWRYEEAVPLLRQYVQLKDLTPYARSVGQINLSAALIQIGHLSEALGLLSRLREETRTMNFSLLHANSLELLAQVFILQKDFDAALVILAEAAGLLNEAGNIFALFVEKWKAIAESLRLNRATDELYKVFAKAQALKHWETVRDCDLYIALFDRTNTARFEHLYSGTPFASFRDRIRSFAGPCFVAPKKYLWSLALKPSSTFDLATGSVTGRKKSQLPLGQTMHRFFIILGRDLYRPLPALGAFGVLFPGEYMNADTSANRVHQVVKRCRTWIEETGLDFRIEEEAGGYRLAPGLNSGILLSTETLPLEATELEWLVLADQLGSKPFEVHAVTRILGCSNSSAQRWLRWAVAKGRVDKSGKASRTSYRLNQTSRTSGHGEQKFATRSN